MSEHDNYCVDSTSYFCADLASRGMPVCHKHGGHERMNATAQGCTRCTTRLHKQLTPKKRTATTRSAETRPVTLSGMRPMRSSRATRTVARARSLLFTSLTHRKVQFIVTFDSFFSLRLDGSQHGHVAHGRQARPARPQSRGASQGQSDHIRPLFQSATVTIRPVGACVRARAKHMRPDGSQATQWVVLIKLLDQHRRW